MHKTFFVTGTDTDAGKTLTTCGLLIQAKTMGYSTAGIKPIASGCTKNSDGNWLNSDALAIQEAISLPLDYSSVNPVALEAAIAPHIAAQQENRHIRTDRLVGFCRGVMAERASLTLIEGAGGWRVPLNKYQFLSELPKQLNIPVILVAGIKLGCINHTLLSIEAIRRDGVAIAGWIANSLEETMPVEQENIDTLKEILRNIPLLGHIPYLRPATPINASLHLQSAINQLLG